MNDPVSAQSLGRPHRVPGCLGCEILAGRRSVPGGTIWEDDFWVLFRLDLRAFLVRLGIRRWIVPDDEVADLAARLRRALGASPPP